VREDYLPTNPSWVDATGLTNVTLLQTAGAPPAGAVEQLYWNRSITREALVGDAQPTDVYAAPRIRVARDGALTGLGDNVLVQDYAATLQFANARLVAVAGSFSLWSAESEPRLSLLERGRFSDGWLARTGKLTVWPDAAGRTSGTLSFTLSLPAHGVATTVRFGKAALRHPPRREDDRDLHDRCARPLVAPVLDADRRKRAARPSLHERAFNAPGPAACGRARRQRDVDRVKR